MTIDPRHRSSALTDGPDRAPARAMLKAVGFSDDDLSRPLVGVANTWIEVMPCNIHLREVAAAVKAGIREAGGTPIEFNTVAVSDGISMGTEGMKASLVSREVVADSIELVARGHLFDAVVALCGCDKTIPGTAMALARLDLPGLVLYGGSIDPGSYRGRDVTIQDVFEAVGACASGRMTLQDLKELEDRACPGPGACGGQFTANTMATALEFVGVSPMGSAGVPATDPQRREVARDAGRLVMDLLRTGTRPRTVMTRGGFENSIASIAATGGSTNGVLHLLALAHEAGVPLQIDDFDRISARTPLLADLKPGGRFVANDMHRAGGTRLLAARLLKAGLLHGNEPTVSGRTLGDEARLARETPGQEVIRPLSNPLKSTGGLVILDRGPGRAPHRRAFLRRHPRPHGRPRRPRGGARRPDCSRAGGGQHLVRRRGAAARSRGRRRGRARSPEGLEASRPTLPERCLRQVRASRLLGEQGGGHVRRAGAFPLATLAALLATPAVWCQEDHAHRHGSPESLGTVRFEVSCGPEAQKEFNHAVALLHSFWYDEAEKSFTQVTVTDPRCGMGHWGVAMSRYHPIWTPPQPDDLKAGLAAVGRARAAGGGTERERAYIAAIEVFYKDWHRNDHLTRAIAYEEAMQKVYDRYPRDHEAGIFYALAILGRALPTDKTYANQKRAAEILNRILPLEPNHPGIAHYMIHSYDYPELASLALPAARAYAKIAPDAPHALHMPSHIFTRLGMWEDSIQSNLASAESAWRQIAGGDRDKGTFDQLHAMDYLEYAYLQVGRDDEAKRVLEDLGRVRRLDRETLQAAYAFAAIPARYALERGRWEEASGLEVGPAWFPWVRFPWPEANVQFARTLGAARSGRPAAARADLERLASIRRSLGQAKDREW